MATTTKDLVNAIKKSGTYTVSAGSHAGEDLYKDNPYRGLTYERSPWQMFLGSLGFRTAADDWLTDKEMQANEWDAGIAQKLNDREYDNPINQVARQRAAGLNPDLDGGSGIGTGDPGVSPDDNSAPVPSASEDLSQAAGVVTFATNAVLTCFQGIIPLVSGVQGLVTNNLKNNILRGENDQKVFDVFKTYVDGMFESNVSGDPEDESARITDFSQSFPAFYESISGRRLSSRQKRGLSHFSAGYLNTLQSRASRSSDRKTLLENDKETGLLSSSEFSRYQSQLSRDFFGVLQDIEDSTYKTLAKHRNQQAQNDLSFAEGLDVPAKVAAANQAALADAAESQYKQDYFNNLDGATRAEAENSEFASRKLSADMQRTVQRVLDKHADILIKSGNWIKQSFGFTLKATAVKLGSYLLSPSL